jgi:hypothetical protein
MDRRQARKAAYLIGSRIVLDFLSSTDWESELERYGVTSQGDKEKVRLALTGVSGSLAHRGRNMRATGGGGNRVQVVDNGSGVAIVPVTANVPQVNSVVSGGSNVTNYGAFRTISPSDMETLVNDEVNRLINADETFTAWNVTKNLRDANRGANIPHFQVRGLVHDYMGTVQTYVQNLADFNGAQAVEYSPAPQVPTPAPYNGSSVVSNSLAGLLLNLNNN